MTDQTNPIQDMDAETKAAHLEQLKAMADTLGIPYKNNIGIEKLAERVKDFQEGRLTDTAVADDRGDGLFQGKSVDELEKEYQIYLARQVVRVSIQCVNPAKSKLVGDVFTVYSTTLGRISQWVPYQAPEGYHLPRALVELLREKVFLSFREIPKKIGETGVDKEHIEIPEFVIRELPPLSYEEWAEIVRRQQRVLSTTFES